MIEEEKHRIQHEYLLQPQIGQATAVNAAIGIGGGSWKDYEDENET